MHDEGTRRGVRNLRRPEAAVPFTHVLGRMIAGSHSILVRWNTQDATIKTSLHIRVIKAAHRFSLPPSRDDEGRHLTMVIVRTRQIDDNVLLSRVVAQAPHDGASRDPFASERRQVHRPAVLHIHRLGVRESRPGSTDAANPNDDHQEDSKILKGAPPLALVTPIF